LTAETAGKVESRHSRCGAEGWGSSDGAAGSLPGVPGADDFGLGLLIAPPNPAPTVPLFDSAPLAPTSSTSGAGSPNTASGSSTSSGTSKTAASTPA
jgi:hypothetical protein